MGKKFDDNVARKLAAALEVNNADEFLFRYGVGYLNFENVLSTLQSKKKNRMNMSSILLKTGINM